MPTIKKLIADLRALSPEKLKFVRSQVWPKPGPKPLSEPSESRIIRATIAVLEERVVLSAKGLIGLTLKELKAIKRSPHPRQSTVFIEVLTKKGHLKIVKIPLSLDAWKWTTQGQAVFRREGQEKFEEWALRETEKLIRWMGLGREELLNLVERHIGDPPRKNRRYPKGGRFAQCVQMGLDEFLIKRQIRYWQIPPGLRDKGPGPLWQEWRIHNFMRRGNTLIKKQAT